MLAYVGWALAAVLVATISVAGILAVKLLAERDARIRAAEQTIELGHSRVDDAQARADRLAVDLLRARAQVRELQGQVDVLTADTPKSIPAETFSGWPVFSPTSEAPWVPLADDR